MKLIGKCKKDFRKYLLKNDLISPYEYSIFENLSEVVKIAHVIGFFDSVKIFINSYSRHKKYEDGNIWYFQTAIVDDVFYSETCTERAKSQLQAIERANEIYNSK